MSPANSEASVVRLLMVSDDQSLYRAVTGLLEAATRMQGFMPHALRLVGRTADLPALLAEQNDCVLLDAALLGEADVPALQEVVVPDAASALRIPMILLTGNADEMLLAQARRLRAHDQWRKDGSSGVSLAALIGAAVAAVRPDAAIAPHDPVTCLPERTTFIKRLERSLAQSQRLHNCFAVLLIGLTPRASASEESARQAWREMTDRVCDAVRQSDTVARLGADELAALITVANVDGALRVARKMMDVVKAHPGFGAGREDHGVAVGVALYPLHGRNREELLRAADGAMYAARRDRVGIVVAPERDERWQGTLNTLGDSIGSALEQDEFVLKFQPQINLTTGALVAAEALVRWHHPDLGLLPPSEFLPQAARDDGASQISLRVMERALDQVRCWRDGGLRVPLSVNLPLRALELDGLCERVQAKLREHDLDANVLTLEVRDENLTGMSMNARAVLQRLSVMGVGFAIDDFGRGTASLLALRDLPVQEIKLDREFTESLCADKADAAIVRAMVAMGGSTGCRVVAKGIENDAVWQELVALGCEFGQGFRFAPPLDANELTGWLERWRGETRVRAVAA